MATAVRVASRQSVGGVKIKQEESAERQGVNQESTFVGEDYKHSLNRTPDLMLDLAKPVCKSHIRRNRPGEIWTSARARTGINCKDFCRHSAAR